MVPNRPTNERKWPKRSIFGLIYTGQFLGIYAMCMNAQFWSIYMPCRSFFRVYLCPVSEIMGPSMSPLTIVFNLLREREDTDNLAHILNRNCFPLSFLGCVPTIIKSAYLESSEISKPEPVTTGMGATPHSQTAHFLRSAWIASIAPRA